MYLQYEKFYMRIFEREIYNILSTKKSYFELHSMRYV